MAALSILRRNGSPMSALVTLCLSVKNITFDDLKSLRLSYSRPRLIRSFLAAALLSQFVSLDKQSLSRFHDC